MDLARIIRKVPDFPKPGILFYDISTILNRPDAWRFAVDALGELAQDYRPTMLAGIESRGFVFGAALAYKLDLGFVMIRKVGKLPGTVVSHSYDLEYGSDTLQIADGIVPQGERIVLIDDLIATGGTARASVELLRKVGAEVTGAVFLIDLPDLGGRARLGAPSKALLAFEGG
jgi:adenine phosphoribosyltransferase